MDIVFIIIKDSVGERISGSIKKYEDRSESLVQEVYINNFKNKRYYEKIRKMIGSYHKTLALLNMRNDDPSIVAVANLILHQVPYSIKYIDMTKTPKEIKYRHYNGVDKSFT